jgi:hypothetical protein
MLSREWLRLILDTAAVNGWSEPASASAAAASGSYFCINPTNAGFIQNLFAIMCALLLVLLLFFHSENLQPSCREEGEAVRQKLRDLEELLHVVVAAPELADLGLALRHQRRQPPLVPPVDCKPDDRYICRIY